MEPPAETPQPRPDPDDERYVDEKAVRDEITRQFSVCVECRQCVDLCGVFPSLFALVDAASDTDPGRLTPHEQDLVVDACHQCGQCVVGCPYAPPASELAVDVPRLILRTRAMQRAAGQQPFRRRVAVALLSPPISWPLAGSRPGSIVRRALAPLTGVSSRSVLPPRARHRFTTWFHARTDQPPAPTVGSVAVVPTCHVEHHHPEVGRDLIACYEHLGVGCTMADVVCCGAPLLHSGDHDDFTKIAARNVSRLAEAIRDGARAVVVPQPTCAHVLSVETPRAIPGDDADLVAAHVRDACEFVDDLAAAGEVTLTAAHGAEVPSRVVLHHAASPHTGRQGSVRLLERFGVDVSVVRGTSGTADTWGQMLEHEAEAATLADALGAAIVADVDAAGGDATVVADSPADNDAVADRIGRRSIHPIQLLARIIGAHRTH